jgi:hypothetical protein
MLPLVSAVAEAPAVIARSTAPMDATTSPTRLPAWSTSYKSLATLTETSWAESLSTVTSSSTVAEAAETWGVLT